MRNRAYAGGRLRMLRLFGASLGSRRVACGLTRSLSIRADALEKSASRVDRLQTSNDTKSRHWVTLTVPKKSFDCATVTVTVLAQVALSADRVDKGLGDLKVLG